MRHSQAPNLAAAQALTLAASFLAIGGAVVSSERIRPAESPAILSTTARNTASFVGDGLLKTTDLSYELQRGSSQLFGRDRRIQLGKGFDAPGLCFLHISLSTEVEVLSGVSRTRFDPRNGQLTFPP